MFFFFCYFYIYELGAIQFELSCDSSMWTTQSLSLSLSKNFIFGLFTLGYMYECMYIKTG